MGKRRCRCAIDQDGECIGCKAIYIDIVKKFKALTDEFNRKMTEVREDYVRSYQGLARAEEIGICNSCGMRYADFFLSHIIFSFQAMSRSMAKQAFKKTMTKVKDRWPGLKTPLTMRAWKKLQAAFDK